jgi:hypothetical protein
VLRCDPSCICTVPLALSLAESMPIIEFKGESIEVTNVSEYPYEYALYVTSAGVYYLNVDMESGHAHMQIMHVLEGGPLAGFLAALKHSDQNTIDAILWEFRKPWFPGRNR